MRTGLVVVIASVLGLACFDDLSDPRHWAKKLPDWREQDHALDRIAQMDVERARAVLPELITLYRTTGKPEHLATLARFADPRARPLFLAALAAPDAKHQLAVVAARYFGDTRSADAVDALIAVAERRMPAKARANEARVEALAALVRIGDKRAIPTFTKLLATSPEQQDFRLNQKAAAGLALFPDPTAMPALIKGLFLKRGKLSTFEDCRLALVRIGPTAIPALLQVVEGKNAEIRELANDRDSLWRAATVLGDLRATAAVKPLAAYLKALYSSAEADPVVRALGLIGTPAAIDPLIALAKDPARDQRVRADAAEALALSGDEFAIPVLLDLARPPKAGAPSADWLRRQVVDAFSRIAGPDHVADFERLDDGSAKDARERMRLVEACKTDIACYGKRLADSSAPKAEKAAFAIAFSGDKGGVPLLLGALERLSTVPAKRYPVQRALVFGLTRLADSSCTACLEKLRAQIAVDEKLVRDAGELGLMRDRRIVLAYLEKKAAVAGDAR